MAEKKLSKKTLHKSYIRWYFFHLCSMSYERLEAFGFLHSMLPIIKELYPDNKEERIQAMKRHSAFYNTEPVIGTAINGIVAGVEEGKAGEKDIDDATINSIKVGLMGPLAGVGDSIIQGLLMPILLSIGMGLSANGSIAGPLFYIFTFLPIVTVLSYWLYFKGYTLGVESLNMFLGDKAKKIEEGFSIVGLTVMGAIGASYVNLDVVSVYASGETSVVVQDILDSIFPKLLPLLLVAISWYLITKKKFKPVKIILLYLIVAVIGVLIGVF